MSILCQQSKSNLNLLLNIYKVPAGAQLGDWIGDFRWIFNINGVAFWLTYHLVKIFFSEICRMTVSTPYIRRFKICFYQWTLCQRHLFSVLSIFNTKFIKTIRLNSNHNAQFDEALREHWGLLLLFVVLYCPS